MRKTPETIVQVLQDDVDQLKKDNPIEDNLAMWTFFAAGLVSLAAAIRDEVASRTK